LARAYPEREKGGRGHKGGMQTRADSAQASRRLLVDAPFDFGDLRGVAAIGGPF
jgi:hypothetical protein